jgi:ribosome-associated protein
MKNKHTPLAEHVLHILEEKLVENIVSFDVQGNNPLTDTIILGSVNNTRKMQAVLDAIRQQSKDPSFPFRHAEGAPDSGWMLIDLGDVILHLFSPEMREKVEVERILVRSITPSQKP